MSAAKVNPDYMPVFLNFTFRRKACACLATQVDLILRDPVDHSPPGPSVHGILQLNSEIQQSLPDLHDSHGMQLHRRLFKKEACCLESRKKLLNMWREVNSVCQIRNLSKRTAGDVSNELETTAAYHRQEVRLFEERAQESWVATEQMERVLSELTRENARLRQLLAQVEFNSQLSPRGLHVPAAPPTAHRGPQGSGEPLGHEAPPARGRVQP
ncbi:hypothetical protein MG293_000057 [Ovis ammon polii]|uniref:Uncharacterized protein n=1 Tax=Ovis ammon polii TaxID=230172 RepID=A0AAD4UJL6_OVIAM|nr:hypothetical protein MG293_000057 [Ovis ammon polii]